MKNYETPGEYEIVVALFKLIGHTVTAPATYVDGNFLVDYRSESIIIYPTMWWRLH